MYQTSTNITPKYRYETHYNYMENSGFFASNCSPLLCYRSVSTTLTAQIPTETLSQTHRVCFMLLCYRSVSTTLTAQILRKRYHKATGFASCFCIITTLTLQIPSGNAIANSQGLLHAETGFSYFGARYYDSDLMTGWLSVDPMADSFLYVRHSAINKSH